MNLLPPPPGACPICATEHAPEEAHNQTSLYYQIRFRGTHGRDPTWADAIAHCDPKTRKLWSRVLQEKKIWSEPPAGVEVIADPPHDSLRQIVEIGSEPIVVRIAR